MLVLLWLPDTVYVEYIFSIAFAYVGHDLKKKSTVHLQIFPPGKEVACCAKQIIV
jgi:hypothetical protein